MVKIMIFQQINEFKSEAFLYITSLLGFNKPIKNETIKSLIKLYTDYSDTTAKFFDEMLSSIVDFVIHIWTICVGDKK